MKKLLSLFIIASFILAGCSSSDEVMTAKQFKTTMEEKGFNVIDQSDSTTDNSYQSIYVAIDDDETYSFEYYFMKNEKSAESLYSYSKDRLNSYYEDDASVTYNANESDKTNEYKVHASDYYVVVIQKENTVLYVTANSDREDDTNTILKDLGY